jgi:hypothetical protein
MQPAFHVAALLVIIVSHALISLRFNRVELANLLATMVTTKMPIKSVSLAIQDVPPVLLHYTQTAVLVTMDSF